MSDDTDKVVIDLGLLRCGRCDPSLSCYEGRSACAQTSVVPASVVPVSPPRSKTVSSIPPLTRSNTRDVVEMDKVPRTKTGELRHEVDAQKRLAVAAGIQQKIAEEARDLCEHELGECKLAHLQQQTEIAQLNGHVAALWFVLGELLGVIPREYMSPEHQTVVRRARDLHASFAVVDESNKSGEG